MNNEEKQLLLQDICARLPYSVVVHCTDSDTAYNCFLTTDILHEIQNGYEHYEYKPYLRPMSSMIEEEKREYRNTMYKETHRLYPNSADFTEQTDYQYTYKTFDYLNSIHVDYRGLIPMGLALEAPEGMYNTKTE